MRDERGLEAFAELGELAAEAEEELELDRLLDRWDERQLLQVELQVARSVLRLRVRSLRELLIELLGLVVLIAASVGCRLTAAKVVEDALSELDGAVGELDRRILVDQTVVEAAEGLVSLTDLPLLPIEFDLYDIVRVSSVVVFILDHPRARNVDLQRDLEEETSLTGAVLGALLHVIDEGLAGEEDCAELALHAEGVLKDTLVDFH